MGANENNLIVKLNQNGGNQLSDVVIVGYGTQKKTSLTASISTIGGKDIAKQPVADLTASIGGRVPGVFFTQASGQAGNDASNIMIRGIGTNGNSQPLIIVDGIPRNFNQLNPSDIESITILKDGAAVAPYGMGGANGVILVTTKTGKTGKPVLSYDGYAGIMNPTVVTKYVNSYQYAKMKNAGAANAGLPAPYSDAVIQKYKDGSDPDAYPNSKALEDIYKRNTLQTSHSLGLSGGTETVKYGMGLGYYYQEGTIPNLDFKRYNVSANMQVQATNSTKVSLSLNGRVEDRNLTQGGFRADEILQNLVSSTPITPLQFSNGYPTSLYAYYYNNPSYQKSLGNVLLSQISLEQKLPVKGLSVKVVAAYDYNPTDPYSASPNNIIQSITRSWTAPYPYYQIDTSKKPYVYTQFVPTTLASFSQKYNNAQAFDYQGYLNYTGNFGKSDVTGLVVLESRNMKASTFSAGRINYLLPIQELFAGSNAAADLSNTGGSMQTKQRSLVYRATYAYDSKYFFEVAGRYDGNYYFSPGHRFGFFPAFSAGWRLSEENFLKNVTWINELKLRGSYGESGNLAGAPFQYLSAYGLYGPSAVLNGAQTQGLYELSEANKDITWERAKKSDIGMDARLFNGLLNISADYFHEERNNMLIYPDVTVPYEYGVGLSQVNAGSMSNSGFELSLGSNYSVNQDLHLSFESNFSFARNKILQVFETSTTYDNPNRRLTGRPLRTPFGYEAIGYFKESDFDASGKLLPGIAAQNWAKVHPGDIRYADLKGQDGDAKPDGIIDANDRIAMGYPNYPAILYGFSPSVTYKNLGVSFLFQGAAQREIQLSEDAAWAFFNGKNAPVTSVDYWTPENQNAPNPRMTTTPSLNNTQTSTFWQRDASYLRLRTMLVSYTIPATISKKAGMNLLKVYVSGQNLITWTPLKNFDPEVSQGRGWYYPTQKSVTLGLNIQF